MNNIDDYKLVLGTDMDNNNIALNDNIAIIGCPTMSRKQALFYNFIKQSASFDKNAGSTYIVNDIDDAYFIYAVAQRNKKRNKVVLIKPSNSLNIYNELINDEPYDYDRLDEMFDYSNYVRSKNIVIIDAEIYKYGDLGRRFLAKLILHMWLSIQNQGITLGRQHYLFFDGNEEFLSFLKPLAEFGTYYNYNLILMIKSFDILKEEDQYMINYLIKNRIILGYNIDKKLDKPNIKATDNNFIYSLISKDGKLIEGCGMLITCEEKEYISLLESAKKIKKDDTVPDNGVPVAAITKEFNDKVYGLNSYINYNNEENETSLIDNSGTYTEVVVEAIVKAKEPYNGEKFNLELNAAQKRHIDLILEARQQEIERQAKEKKVEKENIDDIDNNNSNNTVEDNNVQTIPEEKEAEEIPAIEEVKEDNKKEKKKNKKVIIEDDSSEDIIVKITPKEEIKSPTFESELADTIEKIAEKSMLSGEEEIRDEAEYFDYDEINESESSEMEKDKYSPQELHKITEKAAPGTSFIDINDLLKDEDE